MLIERLAYRSRAPVKLSESLRMIGALWLHCARCLARRIAGSISRRNEQSLSIPCPGV
jgi:hypothetical protein